MFPTLSVLGHAAGNKFVVVRFSPEKAARYTLNELDSFANAAHTTTTLDTRAVLDVLGQKVDETFPPSFEPEDREDVRKARMAAFGELEHVCRFQVNARQCSRNTVDACRSSKANGAIAAEFEGMGNMDAPRVVAARFVLDNCLALRDAWQARYCCYTHGKKPSSSLSTDRPSGSS